MNRYRIGFDMTVLWAIYERDCVTPYNLSDKEVRMFITHDRGREPVEVTKTQLPDGTVNNVIRWFFPGVKQRVLGPYTLTLEILTSAERRVIRKDVCDAFILVGRDCLATEDEGEANINEGGEITLASSLDIYRISPIIPQIGENGNWFVDGVDTGKPARGEAGSAVNTAYVSFHINGLMELEINYGYGDEGLPEFSLDKDGYLNLEQ